MGAKLANRYGNESVCILEVQWTTDGQWHQYADKDIPEHNIEGKIFQIGQLETVVKCDGAGSSQFIQITLSDTNGQLKSILDNNDIHSKIARIYQWIEGVPLDDKFLLLEGQISTPIKWVEGLRTLSFELRTQMADKEIGFSPEEGVFPYLPEELIGKPWPLAFGVVENLKAQGLKETQTCETTNPVYLPDPTVNWAGKINWENTVLWTGGYDYEMEVEVATQFPYLSSRERYLTVRKRSTGEIRDAQSAGYFFATERAYQLTVEAQAVEYWDHYIGLTDPDKFPQDVDIYLIIRGLFSKVM